MRLSIVTTSGEIYVYGGNPISNTALIRKSIDGGASWANVFHDTRTTIRSLAEWNGGIVMSDDYFPGGTTVPYMRVRGTTDDFLTLKTLDAFRPNGALQVTSGFMKVDSRDYLFYSGGYTDSDGLSHLVLRVNRGDDNWETVDHLTGDSTGDFSANDILFNAHEKIFHIASSLSSSESTWIVRRATVNTATAFTPASMAGGSDFISPISGVNKRIFKTWNSHDGNFGATAGAAITAADSFCNSDPHKPVWDSTATYKALLVNSARVACTSDTCTSSGASENLDWIFSPNTTYVTFEGATIGTADASGVFTSLNRPIANNTVHWTWTGLNTAAADWTNDVDNCLDWTSNGNTDFSTFWTARGTDFSEIYSLGSWATCDTPQHLICVEQ